MLAVVREQIAAFCASNLQLSHKKETALVVDYGALSLNLSIVEYYDGELEVKASTRI